MMEELKYITGEIKRGIVNLKKFYNKQSQNGKFAILIGLVVFGFILMTILLSDGTTTETYSVTPQDIAGKIESVYNCEVVELGVDENYNYYFETEVNGYYDATIVISGSNVRGVTVFSYDTDLASDIFDTVETYSGKDFDKGYYTMTMSGQSCVTSFSSYEIPSQYFHGY